MKKLFFILFAFLISNPSLAGVAPLSLPWLASVLQENAPAFGPGSLSQMESLYDCGEKEGERFCSDPVKYYKVTVNGSIWLSEGAVVKVTLTTAYSAFSYSELQLNLRKDGFALAEIHADNVYFNVAGELKSKSLTQVDREAFILLNKGSAARPKTLIWVPEEQLLAGNPSRYAELKSDGKSVELSFYRNH
ncbi:hypothetical protein L3Q72_16620 [Vibrio sp. JC009]|uniref:hypothetical protein n=1 Tax=Vibrio sp. JC009 TaxID=2912314 RepID=UPI0023B2057C|nr:hypothetical protein [Vibrio sp. JC009]WED24499.1 hypothetical protein L3Q72_16620 [Vibrio sp. JC009]